MFALAPKTPHTRLRNENSTHFGAGKAFPKTPLPSAKQILNSTQSGKPVAPAVTLLRKGLVDKTPGTHLQNRGLQFAVQTPSGKTTLFIDQKPPSASRKSVKRPRVSATFKTPNPGTQKPHWDVIDADVSEEIVVQEEKGDNDEPEYMPPRASIPPVETEYGFRSGAELAKILNEMAYTPYHLYDDTPISFDDEPFFIPDELLVVPLGALPDESLPFVESDEEDLAPTAHPPPELKTPTPVLANPTNAPSTTRSLASRRPPQPTITTRASSGATPSATATATKRTPIISARRKSGTTSALRIPLRTASGSTAPVTTAGRSTRISARSTKVPTNPMPAALAGRSSRTAPQAAMKGKGRAPQVSAAEPEDNPLQRLPPALRELLEKNELVFDDFRFDV